MTFTREKLPKSFIPYSSLNICSNILIGGGHIVAVGNILPVIIGKGEKPQIWLQALNDSKKNEFISIVENSVSKHPAVEILETSGDVVVSIQGTIVLNVRQVSENSAEVTEMDLRPIGINLFGNSSVLNVGGSVFAGNTMHGNSVLIGFNN